MRIIITFLALYLAAVSAVPSISQRIVGGELTTIDKYPSMASLTLRIYRNLLALCGGTILNDRSILTAGHCAEGLRPDQIIIRVGSSFINKDGVVHDISSIMVHPDYEPEEYESDIAILTTATPIEFNDVTKPVSIAAADYNLADNEKVWSAGWGLTSEGGDISQQIRHVQLVTINQTFCRERYSYSEITDNMLCAGKLDFSNLDSCRGDSGGPLFHNNVQVGIVSWGDGCADGYHPGVYTRVTRFTDWVESNE